MEDEQNYPDSDYLPPPELLLGPSSTVATEIPLVLVEDGPPNNFQVIEDKENARVDKENESPNSATGRPLVDPSG